MLAAVFYRKFYTDLANFPIAPGLHTQVIQIKDNQTAPEHFYIHVSGTPNNRTPAFDPDGATEALADRPGKLTPFKTPLFDESSDWQSFSTWHQVNEAEGNTGDDRTNKPEPVYQWHYRPEYQFSRFALEMKDIERQYTDEAGNTHTLDLLTGQSEDGKVPTLRSDDDLVSIMYDLADASFAQFGSPGGVDRLNPIDGPQDLVFSLGGEEVQVTMGENQQITLGNLEHIDRLHPADLLTMRLYTNQDAGNALWEYAFTRNGLHVYYKIPGNTEETNGTPERNTEGRDDIEIVSLLNSPEQEDDFQAELPSPIIRTLGGLRLRYRYLPPSIDGATIQKVTWRINHRGRYCDGYGVEPDTGCSEAIAAGEPYSTDKEYAPNESDNVYWEPLDEDNNVLWTLWAGDKTDSDGVTANLFAEYTLPTQGDSEGVLGRSYDQDFVIKTRELAPVTGEDAEPMEGSDVAMLESLLWNLGMSSDHRDYNEAGGAVGIHATRLPSEARNQYGNGGNQDNVANMVGRFNYINWGTEILKIDQENTFTEETLADVRHHWTHYWQAYEATGKRTNFTWPNLTDDQLTAAEAVFDGAVDYPRGKSFSIGATYSQNGAHESVRMLTGADMSRRDILRAMAQQEASGRHWIDYRIVVGGADEAGSKGFNQIQNKQTYGGYAPHGRDKGGISEVVAYLADGITSNVNHYDPAQNIAAKAVWLATSKTQFGGGSFYKAFASNSYAGSYSSSRIPLVAMRMQDGQGETVQVNGGTHSNDAYELLAMALGGYNQGSNIFGRQAWADLLTDPDLESDDAKWKAMSYSMSIMHDADKLDLPYRTYIWQGGTGVDVNDDGEIKDIPADPDAEPPVEGVVEESVPWCFTYGEKEWMDNVNYEDAYNETRRYILGVPLEEDNSYEADCL